MATHTNFGRVDLTPRRLYQFDYLTAQEEGRELPGTPIPRAWVEPSPPEPRMLLIHWVLLSGVLLCAGLALTAVRLWRA